MAGKLKVDSTLDYASVGNFIEEFSFESILSDLQFCQFSLLILLDDLFLEIY